MKRPLHDFNSARVLVMGDVMLDRYWSGATTRVSPEAPVPIVRVEADDERLGGAANVAANVAALGAAVSLIGLVGDDADGSRVQALCRRAGITEHLLRVAGRATTIKLRIIAQHQQLLRLDFETDAIGADDLPGALERLAGDVNMLVLSDYAKGALAAPRPVIDLARRRGLRVIVDPKGRDFARYAGADLLTPNLGEFEAVVGHCADEAEIERRGAALCAAHGFAALLVTRGEHGMSLVRRDGSAIHLAAEARDVFDVTGAGDTVCAVIACAWSAGRDLEESVRAANVAAGLAVARLGTAVVTQAELAEALEPAAPAAGGAVDESVLIVQLGEARRRGRRVVMTNGCFDVLHAGHVRYLEEAARMGDVLVVAVNSDASVRRLKGPTRPLNRLPDRMELLGALRAVDWVVPFDEDTPRRLIEACRPDVLVKGGDYRIEDIAGAAEVLAWGGAVRTVPYHPGWSTTRLIATACDAAAAGEVGP